MKNTVQISANLVAQPLFKLAIYAFKLAASNFDVADLNKDYCPDDLVVYTPKRLFVSLRDCVRGYEKPTFFSVDTPVSYVQAGYVNGDKWLDVITNDASGNFAFALGDGKGGFGPMVNPMSSTPSNPLELDFDLDGDLDQVVAAEVEGKLAKVSVLLNQGAVACNQTSKLDHSGSVTKLPEVAISSPSKTLLVVAGVVAFIVIAAVVLYLYRKNQQHKSRTSDMSGTEPDFRTNSSGIFGGNVTKRSGTEETPDSMGFTLVV